MNASRIAIVLLLAFAIFALAPGALAQGRVLEQSVYLHENLHILPDAIEAEVGDTLQLTVANYGTSSHDLLFCGDGPKSTSDCDDRWAYVSLAPNETAQLTVPVKKAGTFDYYCTIPGHKQGGMRGELRVAGGEARETPAALAPLALVAVGLAALAFRRTR